MKKYFLILSAFLLCSGLLPAQDMTKPAQVLKMENNITPFGKNLPDGSIIYDKLNNKWYFSTSNILSSESISTADSLSEFGSGSGGTVPDSYWEEGTSPNSIRNIDFEGPIVQPENSTMLHAIKLTNPVNLNLIGAFKATFNVVWGTDSMLYIVDERNIKLEGGKQPYISVENQVNEKFSIGIDSVTKEFKLSLNSDLSYPFITYGSSQLTIKETTTFIDEVYMPSGYITYIESDDAYITTLQATTTDFTNTNITGKLGVGTTTPLTNAEIKGGLNLPAILTLTGNDNTLAAGQEIATLQFRTTDASPMGTNDVVGKISAMSVSSTGGISRLGFFPDNNSATLTEKMTLTYDGRLGLNKIAPNFLIDAYGTYSADIHLSTPLGSIVLSTYPEENYGSLYFEMPTMDFGLGRSEAFPGDGVEFELYSSTGIRFSPSPFDINASYITTDGKWGIGTASPSHAFEINKASDASFYVGNGTTSYLRIGGFDDGWSSIKGSAQGKYFTVGYDDETPNGGTLFSISDQTSISFITGGHEYMKLNNDGSLVLGNIPDLEERLEAISDSLRKSVVKTDRTALIAYFVLGNGAQVSDTDSPLARRFFKSSALYISQKIDLSGYTYCRLSCQRGSVAAAATYTVNLEFSTFWSTTLTDYSSPGSIATSLNPVSANQYYETAWIPLINQAVGNNFFTITTAGGDGVLDPNFGNIRVEFK